MAASPRRDPLRDAEARVRALTREVGTLREDLRREVKRRERAVAQAKENEETRREMEARASELSYSNRKLAAELDALHEAARAGAERDRRALRGLREGLAEVEAAVAERAHKGHTQARLLQEAQQQLRDLLFGAAADQPLLANVTTVSSAAAPHAEQLLSTAQALARQLASLLAGTAGDGGLYDGSGGDDADVREAPHTQATPERQRHAGRGGRAGAAHGVGVPGGSQLQLDMEKEQLKDEVVRLRAELRLLADRAAGSSAALELQQSLREATAEVARLQAEVVHLNAAAAAAAREQAALQSALDEARARLRQQDELHAQLVASVRKQEDSSLGRVADLMAKRVELEGEVSSLGQQVSALRHQVGELLEERRSMEGMLAQREDELRSLKASMLQQDADLRNALSLVSRPAAAAARSSLEQALAQPPATHVYGGGSSGAASALPLPQPQLAFGLAAGHSAVGAGASASSSAAAASAAAAALNPALASALAPYHNASAAIGSALAAAAALVPVPGTAGARQAPKGMPPSQQQERDVPAHDRWQQAQPLRELTQFQRPHQLLGQTHDGASAAGVAPARPWGGDAGPQRAPSRDAHVRGIKPPPPAGCSAPSSTSTAAPGPAAARADSAAAPASVRWWDEAPRDKRAAAALEPGPASKHERPAPRAHAHAAQWSHPVPRQQAEPRKNRLAALRQDMQSLDEEFARMEASLASSAARQAPTPASY